METLCDTHCHLDYHAFDADREAIVQRARQAGVVRIMNPGLDLPSSRAAVELAGEVPEVYAAVGIHPNDAQPLTTEDLEDLRRLAVHPKVRAIGEIGLDYYRDRTPRETQHRVFRRQLELAAELGLPVIVHNRDANQDLIAILGEWQQALERSGSRLAENPGVLHAFSGEAETVEFALRHHFFLGIGGPVTFKNATKLQELVALLPLDCLLVETDAPFLAPHPQRGQRNEPAYVRLTAEKIAELKSLPLSEIAQVTSGNAVRLFNW